jgi:hypothetical protein
MMLDTERDASIEERITGWIAEETVAHQERTVWRMVDAERQGLWPRARALRSAVLAAQGGNGQALRAALAMARRIQLIACVYDLDAIHDAAVSIAEACRDDSAPENNTRWAGAELALATLEKMDRGATSSRLSRRSTSPSSCI